MDFFLVVIFLAFSSVRAEKLFTLKSNSFVDDCKDSFFKTCSEVSVNFEALFNDDQLEFPNEIIATKLKKVQRKDKNNASFTFQNSSERLEAVFVSGESSGHPWISGSLNWAKQNRHFQLSFCRNKPDCFIWSELDPEQWVDDTDFLDFSESFERKELNEEQVKLLELGQKDRATPVEVSVTIHITESFSESFDYSALAIQAFIDQTIAETNQGYSNSDVPIVVSLHCVVQSEVPDDVDLHVMMADFKASAMGDLNVLRRGADIAVLMTATDADVCGVGKVDSIESGNTLAVIKKKCAVGYYSFGHEIGHMYGCLHNREEGKINLEYPAAYGFLMRPPLESGLRTILAYTADGYKTRVNYYSGPNLIFEDVPTGDAENDNSGLIAERRFLMSNVGKEELSCEL